MADTNLDLTLVIDIGKSNAKLLLLDDSGSEVERHDRANTAVTSPLGYPALDVHGLQAWMQSTLRASPNAKRCGHAIASTHGAAMVALTDAALAWDPIDYEFEDVARNGVASATFEAASDSFRDTLSPLLPAGLNAARQLFWMQNQHTQAWRKTRCLLPYPQYWTWVLSGVASSEVTSLGCHTHLWSPVQAGFSNLAITMGWAELFAPMRPAWEVLGPVQPHITCEWGLPAACQVHVGVHDSNACLARYLDGQPHAAQQTKALTIVSSGTWTVLMAPGAPAHALEAEKDMLGNVDVIGRTTPTARFMGGREFAAIADGADPTSASTEALKQLIESKTWALPSFSRQGGPFADRIGALERCGHRLEGASALHLSEAQRATLAATYCAQVSAWLIQHLWAHSTATNPQVVVEGPLAHNPIYMLVLQTLLPGSACCASTDTLEGTARGAWLLSHWGRAPNGLSAQSVTLQPVQCDDIPGLRQYHDDWLASVNSPR